MSVTVVSCCYGPMHGRFFPRWHQAIEQLDPAPDAAMIASDGRWAHIWGNLNVDAIRIVRCRWRHPQAYYLHKAIQAADTDWVWIVDIDDFAMPDGLVGLEDVAADVWQMGFQRSDGEVYVPPQLTAEEFLASDQCVFVGSSAIRTDAYRRVGGFRDVAFQDWALWRDLAAANATFASSGRAHFHYMRHEYARGETELTQDRRAEHLAEMMGAQVAA